MIWAVIWLAVLVGGAGAILILASKLIKSDDKAPEITGEPAIKYRAQVMCSGTNDFAKLKYNYIGVHDCIAAERLAGGGKACPNGCIGFGSCVKYCKSGAVSVINGAAAVDYNKCAGCGECAAVCPKKIIKLMPFEASRWVGCIPAGKIYCTIGCIACRVCEKKCPAEAVNITPSAFINYEKCTGCGGCESVCPRRVIWSGASQESGGLVRAKEIPDI
jgi:ferredoxin